MKLYKKIEKNINEIIKMNGNSSDLCVRNLLISGKKICVIYLASVASDDKVSDFLIRSIKNCVENISFLDDTFKILENSIYNSNLKVDYTFSDLYYKLSSGFAIILVNGYSKAITVEARMILDRGVSLSTSETNTVGPKDAFTENHNINLGLIRKRIKSDSLKFKEFVVGSRGLSKVTIGYIDDVVFKDSLNLVLDKIKKIEIDAVLDTGYIRDFLTNDSRTHFPTVIHTERPDIASASLLEGKIIILVENSPFSIVVPGYLNDFLHASEDSYQKANNMTMTRILRFIAFIFTIFLPGLYIAITTFNQEVIPDTLLTSLSVQRKAVPFPTSFSVILLMITFEILRECDMRIPETMGTSISIVGALVLGEAVVNAGIVSPIVVLVVAISSITGLIFTDLEMVNALRYWKLIFILFSSIMGLIGFLCITLIFVNTLCAIEIFGVSYLVPFSPFIPKSLKDAFCVVSRNKLKTRPSYLSNNKVRLRNEK